MNDFLQSLRNGQADKPRTPKTRRNSDNSYQHTNSSRFHSYGGYQNNKNQNMKRQPALRQVGNQLPMDDSAATSVLTEAIENLSSHVEILINTQKKTTDILERQAIAIERIVDHLNIAPKKQPASEKGPVAKETVQHHSVTAKKQKPDTTEPVKAPVKNIKLVKPSVKPVLRKRKKLVVKKAGKAASPQNKTLMDSKLLSREAIMDIIQSMRAESATFDQVASRLIELGQPTFSGRGEWHAQTIHRLCNKK